MKCIYYAELLANLKRLNISLAFDESTSIRIQIEKLTGKNKGQNCVVIDDQNIQHFIPIPKGFEVSELPQDNKFTKSQEKFNFPLRLIEDVGTSLNSLKSSDTAQPLSAEQLALIERETFDICCRKCCISLLAISSSRDSSSITSPLVSTFKDLPSENWAELMECWLCHKAPGKDQAFGAAINAASRQISAQNGVCLVGSTYFLMHCRDLRNLDIQLRQVSSNQDEKKKEKIKDFHARCLHCTSVVGRKMDPESESVRLFKFAVQVKGQLKDKNGNPSKIMPSYPITLILLNIMLEEVSAHANSRFLLKRDDNDVEDENENTAALLWLFSHDCKINSNIHMDNKLDSNSRDLLLEMGGNSDNPYRSFAKVFYAIGEQTKSENPVDSSIEEIRMPTRACDEILTRLEISSLMFPEDQRSLGAFKIGVIERYY